MIKLTEEQRRLKETVSRFVREHLFPVEAEVLNSGKQIVGTKYEQWGSKENYKALQEKAKDIGLWSLFLPEEHGGAALSYTDFIIVYSEVAKCSLPFHFGGDIPMAEVLLKSDPSIVKNYIQPVIEGEKQFAFANSESEAGSDAAAIKTKAVKKGDKWVLTGTKMWVTDGAIADFIFATAITDPGKRKGGMTMFMVDKKTADRDGFEVIRNIPVMGGCTTGAEILLDDVEVPETHVVGKVGDGFNCAQEFFSIRTRLEHAAINIGICDRSLNIARDHARQRKTFGDTLINRQAIQWMLADSAIELHAMTLMAFQVAEKANAGEDVRHEIAMLKVYTDEKNFNIIDRCIQICGAAGLSHNLPLEKFFRNARVTRIGGGSMEVMRMSIARNLNQSDVGFSTLDKL